MKIQELVHEYVNCGGVVEFLDLLQREEVDVVGAVDGLRCAEDVVCDGDAATED